MKDVAETLLEAHVRHELERLTGERLDAGIRAGVTAILAWLEDVSMNDVLAREQIHEVIDRYVIDLKVSGGITELAGEMSHVVFASASSKHTRVDDVLSPQGYEEFAEKLTEFEGVLRRVVGYVTRTAAFRTLASRLIVHDAAQLLLRGEVSGDRSWTGRMRTGMQRRFPGIQRQVGALISRFGDVLADRVATDAERRLLEVLDVDWLRLLADEVWSEISTRPIADAGLFISEEDLEDFVVLGYEVWSRFRKTAYFRAVSFEIVDRLFQKYGEESLRSVIQDMGVTEEMIVHELITFLRPLFDEAHRSGFLEIQIRARLEAFYRSPIVGDILRANAAISASDQLTK